MFKFIKRLNRFYRYRRKGETLKMRAWDNDVNRFGESLYKELYRRPFNELTQKEIQKVNDIIFSVDQWKKVNRKEGFSFTDAYALMNNVSIN